MRSHNIVGLILLGIILISHSSTILAYAPSYVNTSTLLLSSANQYYGVPIGTDANNSSIVYFTAGTTRTDSNIHVYNLDTRSELRLIRTSRDAPLYSWPQELIVRGIISINSSMLAVLDGANRGVILLDPSNSNWIRAWHSFDYQVFDFSIDRSNMRAVWQTYSATNPAVILQLISLNDGSVIASAGRPATMLSTGGLTFDPATNSYYITEREASTPRVFRFDGMNLQLRQVIDLTYPGSTSLWGGVYALHIDVHGTFILAASGGICLRFANETIHCPSSLTNSMMLAGSLAPMTNGNYITLLLSPPMALSGVTATIMSPYPDATAGISSSTSSPIASSSSPGASSSSSTAGASSAPVKSSSSSSEPVDLLWSSSAPSNDINGNESNVNHVIALLSAALLTVVSSL